MNSEIPNYSQAESNHRRRKLSQSMDSPVAMLSKLSKPIPKEGYKYKISIFLRLIFRMVMEGLADVSFSVHGTVIQALKPFLKYNNKYLSDLIKKNENSLEPIQLDECITPEGFNSMLLYYGYGKPDPDIPYLADTLIASLFLHEDEFFKTLRKYLFIIIN